MLTLKQESHYPALTRGLEIFQHSFSIYKACHVDNFLS